MMFLYNGMEKVLGADAHFLLGRWVEDAKTWATSDAEAKWLEFNARNQVTLWGPNGEVGSRIYRSSRCVSAGNNTGF